MDSTREEALSTENGITIFASFSLPDYVLEDLLRTASEHKARVVFNGLKERNYSATRDTGSNKPNDCQRKI